MSLMRMGGLFFYFFAVMPAWADCLQTAVPDDSDPPFRESKCLPRELPADFLERNGFVIYESLLTKGPPLVHKVIFFNALRNPRDSVIEPLFTDIHAALLPAGKKIRVIHTPKEELWDYPVGTRLVHRISFQYEAGRVFEFRMLEKLQDGMWAYGAYLPKETGGYILREMGAEPDWLQGLYQNKQGEVQPYKLVIKRVHTESCRSCHSAHGSELHQYGVHVPSAYEWNYAGPCGFGPANTKLKRQWARRYKHRHGIWPFE